MLGYTPRVNGYPPGRPIASDAGRSASVYSGLTGTPDRVLNGASRSGMSPYASRHSASVVGTV
jgi:hypothetical protein